MLREEGIRVISSTHPATIMTDPEMADATYIEPSPPILEKIIAKERLTHCRPRRQTALNAAVALGEAGILDKYHVELIGASLEAIDRGG